ncbi:MAG: radical SAM protein [Planctomycetes bacterium]|nr:radical SAM protein [Planctomycetota bacterium]
MPRLRAILKSLDARFERAQYFAAGRVSALIRPAPRQITIAITADCNLRCIGCRYGRDFMTGSKLDLETVLHVLDDARKAGVNRARFFGGEPLLHEDLPAMIRHAKSLGLDAYVTTNATLLERRIDELAEAGLDWMTMGFYGTGSSFDDYTQTRKHFERLERGLERLRDRWSHKIEAQLNFVLHRRTADLESLERAWGFAQRFGMAFSVDPVSETIPFFADPKGVLDFEEHHRGALRTVADALLAKKRAHPERMPQSAEFLNALPALLLDHHDVQIPCDAYDLIWVGANGVVQLCDTAFPLGNVHERPLRDILFTAEHKKACVDAFRLQCPNCHCKIDSRMRKHGPSLRRFAV